MVEGGDNEGSELGSAVAVHGGGSKRRKRGTREAVMATLPGRLL